MRRPAPELFRDIAWGTGGVLAATLRKMESAGLKAALLPEWLDIDTPSDLSLLTEMERRLEAGLSPRTVAWMRKEKPLT